MQRPCPAKFSPEPQQLVTCRGQSAMLGAPVKGPYFGLELSAYQTPLRTQTKKPFVDFASSGARARQKPAKPAVRGPSPRCSECDPRARTGAAGAIARGAPASAAARRSRAGRRAARLRTDARRAPQRAANPSDHFDSIAGPASLYSAPLDSGRPTSGDLLPPAQHTSRRPRAPPVPPAERTRAPGPAVHLPAIPAALPPSLRRR